ncbi:unnamed protein product [Staurois parvus]|uniref:Uncharacterized protein n=1 Tax=Staurois parvus TaxID=386267 RepID=A0ABN9FDI0_9NEOB|nr:unnamed protein product [Staurois parvus]
MGPLYRPPHAAARPVICSWALYRPPNCCQVQSVSWVPVPSHCCCLHRHTLPCATFRSPHTAGGGFHFCHRVVYGLPLLLPPPPHCGSTLWFWPRDCPNE